MLSPEFDRITAFLVQYAITHEHEYIVSEHLLFGLLQNERIVQLLDELSIDTNKLSEQLQTYLATYIPRHRHATHTPTKVQYSAVCQRIFRRAIVQLQSSGHGEKPADVVDILISMLEERDSYATQLLNQAGLTRLKLIRHVVRQNQQNNQENIALDNRYARHDDKATQSPKAPKADPLKQYTQNLNELAKQAKIDPLIGRSAEIERVAQILCRRRKNNPLLVGDPGVGKTAIIEGLAWLIVHGKVADALKSVVIYSLDVGALVAGTKFRGDFEARMKSLLDALKKIPNAILFVDEIHIMVGAGATNEGSMDMSNLIKPALANGELRCIGSTTFVEFRQIFEKDGALSRRFQKVDIKEPSIDDSIAIITGLADRYQQHHGVIYSPKALAAAVELSVKYIHERFLPDKAIDVIDEAGARVQLAQTLADKDSQVVTIEVADIETVVASMAQMPPLSVKKDELSALKTLKEDLGRMVFGQDEAIDRLVDAIILSKAGLKTHQKPIGSFMFAGPTGVGKTEIARQLACALGIELIRFDMSEYMEVHAVSRLIGSPPGYIGFDKGGLLTEKIHQTPYCVLLLDELEKAHSDIYNILLQVMDYGKLTDNNGREVSFRQVIVIMTTNVGAENISRNSMGFTKQDHSGDNSDAMKRAFSPEFRNRLDAIVQFKPLDKAAIGSVVDKFLLQLQVALDDKNVRISISDTARQYLIDKGYDPIMGARPMARLIDDEIKKPLASELLFGELSVGGEVFIDCVDDKLVLDTTVAV